MINRAILLITGGVCAWAIATGAATPALRSETLARDGQPTVVIANPFVELTD